MHTCHTRVHRWCYRKPRRLSWTHSVVAEMGDRGVAIRAVPRGPILLVVQP
jgi:hypothetical protein